MKYKNIAFIIIILSLWINPVNADSKVAPYADIPTQYSANWPENYTDAEFIQVNNNDRIRQNGDISKIKFDVANASNLMEFYFTIWRKNDNGGYDRIAITDNLNGDISDGINEIELSVPISGVQEGDYYGYRIKTSGPALYIDTREVRLTYFVNNSASPINFDWESKEWGLYIFVIESFMNNPYMVFIGDSIISGNVAHHSFIENTDVNDIPSTIENHWSGKTSGMTYQNMGHSGHRTSDLDARFNSDVVELSSEFVLIEGGVNDVNCHRFTADEISNNLESMIQKAYSNKITPVIMLILPENDHSSEQDYGTYEDLAKIDEINNNLIEIAARYTPSIVVDARSYVGVERSSGPDGNLWDINPNYNSGDGIHFNSAGHERIAQAIKDSFKYIYGKPGLYNLIQSDGTIIYSEGLSNAINTSWRMASNSSTANVTYNEPSTDEIADFTINNGSIKWFTIYDLSQDQVYHLRRSDGTLIESSTALNGIVNFTMTGGLSTGTYHVDTSFVITDVNYDTPTNDSVNITWETNKNSDSLVEYGTTSGNYPSNTYVQETVISHSIELSGLSPGITYYFIITSTDSDNDLAQSDEYFFTTADIATTLMLSQPEDQTIEQGSTYVITWVINGTYPGQYLVLRDGTEVVVPTDYQCDGDNITIQVDTSTLGIWNYTIFANDTSGNTVTDQVNITIQDTTLPIIITATANPTVIEANGTQCIILNVTAIDIGSGIASVTVDLSAIGGFPVQVMTLDDGIWQFIAYTKIIGTFRLPINVTDKVALSNTSVNIPLNAVDTILPLISSPEDQLIEQSIKGNITWIITEAEPHMYWVLRNGTEIVPPSYYQSGVNITVLIENTLSLGVWNYTIFANDTLENTASNQVIITVQENISIAISIVSPYDGYYTTSMSIVVTGYVDGNGSVPTVFVNEVEAETDLVGFAGNYTKTVPLNVGTNSITVTAYNTMNEKISDSVKVFRKKVSTSSSKSGGGGGGGASGEDFNNIMISETQREFVSIGEDISYDFDSEGNIVRYINFTGYLTAGTVPAKVDILNHTSSLVNYAPLDIVYKNLNIWVGYKGWANSKNIANATISFNLEKSWINGNNIDRSTIKMKRYYNGKWNTLETTLIDQDVKYLYFESKIAGFSSFVITGKQRYTDEPDEPGEEGIGDDKPLAVVTETLNNTSIEAPTEDENGIPGFGLFICLVVWLMVIWKIRKE